MLHKNIKNDINVIKKKVEEATEKKLKRETLQAKQLRQYLKKIERVPSLDTNEKVKLWDELWKVIKEGNEKEKLKLEKKIFRANLKEVISIAREFLNKSYIKPYFTFLEVIKEGKKGLWKAIHEWPEEKRKLIYHNFSVFMRSSVSNCILEAALRKEYKIVTGKDYQDNLPLVNITYAGDILDNPKLKSTEEKVTKELLKKERESSK